jgi:Tol biopolymer transport system component
LIYSSNKGQWQIAANGKPTLIITGTNSLVSPNGQMAIKPPTCCRCVCDDGYQLVDLNTGKSRDLPFDYRVLAWSADSRYIYYITNSDRDNLSDIWRWDVITSERRNLTRTPNRDEGYWLTLWPERPDTLVFYSTEGYPDGAGWIGHLTVMRTDGTDYQVISPQGVSSPAAFSPDGHTIAYTMHEAITSTSGTRYVVTSWYYRIGSQPQRFPWKNFGLTKFATMGFSSPSWSPDGQKIAWWMGGYDENHKKKFGGIGIFDLELGTTVLVDNFAQHVWDGWPEAVDWSPDGKRIVFFGGRPQSENLEDWGGFGIWTAQADGSHLRRLIDMNIEYNVCNWAWQPDGQWLAISCRESPEVLSGIWLAELETGRLLKTNLPDDAQIRGWVNPQP